MKGNGIHIAGHMKYFKRFFRLNNYFIDTLISKEVTKIKNYQNQIIERLCYSHQTGLKHVLVLHCLFWLQSMHGAFVNFHPMKISEVFSYSAIVQRH